MAFYYERKTQTVTLVFYGQKVYRVTVREFIQFFGQEAFRALYV